MIKKLMLIGLLGLSLVGLLRTEAKAQGACEPTLLSFYGICVVMDLSDFSVEAGSVDVSTILKQLKNASVTLPAIEIVTFLQHVKVRCKSGESQEFDVIDLALDKTQAIDASKVAKNGRFLADSFFSDEEIKEAVLAVIEGSPCPEGTTVDKIAVTEMQVVGTLFTCQFGGDPTDPRETGCIVADALAKECAVPPNQNPFTTPFTYSCSTVCQGVPDENPATDDCKQPVIGNEFYPTS